MGSTFGIIFGAIFVSNIILSQFLGMCSFLGVSKNFNNSVGMSAAVSFVMLLATILSYGIYYLLLVPYHLEYLNTLVFILAIATLVQLVEMFMKKAMPALHKAMGIYLPLITTNCAILGIALINVTKNYDFIDSVANSIGTSLGYTMAILLFSCIRERLDEDALPKCLRSLPIALITASCMSISMMGMSGIH
ncbi:RnfABCDGE type electron transport complex subunit A [Acidaminococcus sp. NSJ-142]|jgi:electron transport complex protein RnfA|uniref:electron transport complex protein RnfA n=1 Tax=Acidaminococcus TaxID=904 RepID=UPI000CF8CE36|nr:MULTISPECIES: RnfABCDGE type electron transport complex subunit A [Acidaminococcus]MCD2434544.1 RnfABCDGE type electron transport complex subunit A [Acidaminococcus hominis]MCH4096934.1 RnfABCDGE type electron transport complex subunit A [Acidaminococcus provencensis]RHK03822.1 RnfABCDGE type electron transport complex subunit A [Acidaminococcus sp. AM05-11]